MTTFAPQFVSCRTAVGPARTRVRSRTVKRERACDAFGADIGIPSYCRFRRWRGRFGLASVSIQSGSFDAGNAASLIIIGRVTADTHGADHVSARVLDEHTAWHRNQRAPRHGVGCIDEIGLFVRALEAGACADAHREGAVGLAVRALVAHQARAILKDGSLDAAAGIEHHDGHRLGLEFGYLGESSVENLAGGVERQCRHGCILARGVRSVFFSMLAFADQAFRPEWLFRLFPRLIASTRATWSAPRPVPSLI